jgi:peptidoglycan/xylan/chitin deacetylase (PgdA/CDA1 family)
MLNFRTANRYLLIFAAVAILLLIIDYSYGWLLVILLVLYIYLLVKGSVNICSNFYMSVFCKANTTDKLVALTFDDGPDAVFTPQILDILDKHKVTATFFVIGGRGDEKGKRGRGEEGKRVLKMIYNAGHCIGNHSYSHAFFFDLFGRKKMEQDLLKTDRLIQDITGKKTLLFRPPYGVTNPILAKVVKRLGFRAIGWSVRSLDTVLKDEDKVVERIIDRLHPGAVILMHDNREMAVKVLEKVILKIKEEGYRFVSIDEMILHQGSDDNKIRKTIE